MPALKNVERIFAEPAATAGAPDPTQVAAGSLVRLFRPGHPWRIVSDFFDVGRVRLATPITFLDVHDLLFGHAEVVTELMNQRLADRNHDLVFVVLAFVLDDVLE